MDAIRDVQNEVDKLIKRRNLSYDDLVPYMDKLEKQLTTYPNIVDLHLPVDIYVETLTRLIARDYLKGVKIDYPPHCVVLMLSVHLYLLELVMCRKTFDEWLSYRKVLLDALVKTFSDKPRYACVVALQSALSTTYDVEHKSALYRAKYFIDCEFRKQFIAIPADKLPGYKTKDVNYLVVNASFNNNESDSIVLYNNVERATSKFLNPNTITDYKMCRKCEMHPSTEWFTILDSNMKRLTAFSSKIVHIVLCYNDESDYAKCHYTVAFSRQSDTPTREAAQRFIDGYVDKTLTEEDINAYLRKRICKLCADEHHSVNELRSKCAALNAICGRAFTPDRQTTIKNILSDEALTSVIDESEKQWFALYLQSTIALPVYNAGTLSTHVLEYIYPDVFNASEFNDA